VRDTAVSRSSTSRRWRDLVESVTRETAAARCHGARPRGSTRPRCRPPRDRCSRARRSSRQIRLGWRGPVVGRLLPQRRVPTPLVRARRRGCAARSNGGPRDAVPGPVGTPRPSDAERRRRRPHAAGRSGPPSPDQGGVSPPLVCPAARRRRSTREACP
jgi:hypothetical protein